MNTKNYIKGIVSLLSLFILLGLAASCKKAAEKTAEKMIEKSLKKSTGEDVDIDLKDQKAVIETEEGRVEVEAMAKSWPEEIPSSVPKFSYGKISGVTTTSTDEGNMWTIVFSDVSENATGKYNSDLKANGFKTQTVNMSGIGGTVSAEKDKITVALVVGEKDASVTIQVKK